ncbi:MAG: cell wall hydrolase [Lachnospiraceae bacterium]|nr:cell wall hydrolase [Lachnospiraceae bacterium]
MKRRKYTWKENLLSVVIALVISGILFLVLRPLYLKEQEERRRIEREWIQEQIEADRAYEAEVAAERERWEQMEQAGSIPVTDLTEEDIKEMDYWGELELLAAVVEAEAGNQDMIGKRLVVDVVLNRVDSPLFPDTITEVLEQPGQFTTMWNGAVEDAGYHMQQDDYDAVMMEVTGKRLDYDIYFFTAGEYNASCKPAYIHGDHYFGYLSDAAKEVVQHEQ